MPLRFRWYDGSPRLNKYRKISNMHMDKTNARNKRKSSPVTKLSTRYLSSVTMRDVFGFENQSQLYNAFRPEYPKPLVDYVINSVTATHPPGVCVDAVKGALDSCVIDVACGTGLFTRQIAPYFKKAVGVDQSDAQLAMAISSPDLYENISYINHDGYDLKGALEKMQLNTEDIKLVTIAQGFHWLDFEKFVRQFTSYFPTNTLFTPIGYSRPHVMNGNFLFDRSVKEAICNPEIIRDSYDGKLLVYERHMNDLYDFLLPYFEFDRRILENYYLDLPFGNHFEYRDFQRFSEIKETDWFRFQQYIFSISAYRVCVEENSQAIEEGTFKDPLVTFLKIVLETEGKLSETNSPDFTSPEDAEVLKSIKFDIIWNYFVYVLNN